MSKKCLPFLLIILLLSSCKGPKAKDVDQKNAVYFWKTNWDFSTAAMNQVDSLNVKVFYLHFFDVDWDKETHSPMPIAIGHSGQFAENPFLKHEIIPTVFITNDVFKNINESDIPDLANKVHKKIVACFKGFVFEHPKDTHEIVGDYSNPYRLNHFRFDDIKVQDSTIRACYKSIKEVQFDCDWTESTRDKYFRFLTHIKKKFEGKIVSATIRLYPFKYSNKAGVPPVDKGMLMCYNVGDVTRVEEGNSIFNKKEILKYLNGKNTYPLPLDYAFPIFEWVSVYRNDKLIKLLQKNELDYYLNDTSEFEVLEKANEFTRYRCRTDMVFNYMAFKFSKDDIIKSEHIPYDAVIDIAGRLSKMNTNQTPNISLFYYDYETIKQHKKEIKNIYSKF